MGRAASEPCWDSCRAFKIRRLRHCQVENDGTILYALTHSMGRPLTRFGPIFSAKKKERRMPYFQVSRRNVQQYGYQHAIMRACRIAPYIAVVNRTHPLPQRPGLLRVAEAVCVVHIKLIFAPIYIQPNQRSPCRCFLERRALLYGYII